jgi:hypothetical protein
MKQFLDFEEFSISENLRYSGKDVSKMPIIGKVVTKPMTRSMGNFPPTEYDIVEIIKGRDDKDIYVANFWYKPGIPQLIHSELVDKWIPLELEEKRGLWDNVWAKRKRGEKPAKPGDKDYPDSKSWKAAQKK